MAGGACGAAKPFPAFGALMRTIAAKAAASGPLGRGEGDEFSFLIQIDGRAILRWKDIHPGELGTKRRRKPDKTEMMLQSLNRRGNSFNGSASKVSFPN